MKEQGLRHCFDQTDSFLNYHIFHAVGILGVDFSPERPPSTMQLFKLMANPAFRKSVQKLREDLANAGVNVDPEVCLSVHDKSPVLSSLELASERDGDVERFQGPISKVEINCNYTL
jgi:hypothetical protein